MIHFQDADLLRNVLVKDFEYFVDRDHSFSHKIRKTQQKADNIWMEQLTAAEGGLFIFEFLVFELYFGPIMFAVFGINCTVASL